MKRPGLRSKIVGVFVLLYGSIFVLLLLWIVHHTQNDFGEAVDQDLKRMGTQILAVARSSPDNLDSLTHALATLENYLELPIYVSLQLDGEVLFSSHGLEISSAVSEVHPRERFESMEIEEHWYRIYHFNDGEFTLHLAEEITATAHTFDEAFATLLISIPLTILISILAGYFLVRRVLLPLDRVTSLAGKISSENLHQRIDDPGSRDELSRLVRTLNGMIDRLEQSFVRLEQFSANAAHELRTPLTILKGELEVALQQERSTTELRQTLDSNLEEVERISRTVEHMFLLSKMDGDLIEIEWEDVNLRHLLEDVCDSVRILAEPTGIQLSYSPESDGLVRGDTVLLVELFMNLLDNAIKYNSDGGSVQVRLWAEVGTVRVAVKDSGVGIPVEEQGQVFERFYRVDKRMSRRQGGAGLGLSLAKWIIDRHKGKVRIDSKPGRGTRVTVILPGRAEEETTDGNTRTDTVT